MGKPNVWQIVKKNLLAEGRALSGDRTAGFAGAAPEVDPGFDGAPSPGFVVPETEESPGQTVGIAASPIVTFPGLLAVIHDDAVSWPEDFQKLLFPLRQISRVL